MPQIILRRFHKKDLLALEEITYRTGYNGEDLTYLDMIEDKHLFFLIFTYYYFQYESKYCFVTTDNQTAKVVGYIVGTPNTKSQKRRFYQVMPLKIIRRALFYTVWQYPKTLISLLSLRKIGLVVEREIDDLIIDKYPAHLHMNVLPEYQHRGIGTELIKLFENELTKQEVKGVHLQTSNYNRKAIPFYQKCGFSIIKETKVDCHPYLDDFRLLTLAKSIIEL